MLATLSLRAGEELINCFSHPPLHLNDGEGPPDPWQPFLNASSRHVPGQHFPAWVRKNCDLSALCQRAKACCSFTPVPALVGHTLVLPRAQVLQPISRQRWSSISCTSWQQKRPDQTIGICGDADSVIEASYWRMRGRGAPGASKVATTGKEHRY